MTNEQQLDRLEDRVRHIEQALFGDDRIGLHGIQADVKVTRSDVSKLVGDRDRIRWVLTGVVVALIITGSSSIVSLVTLARLAAAITGVPVP